MEETEISAVNASKLKMVCDALHPNFLARDPNHLKNQFYHKN